MATINTTTSQGGYLNNQRAASLALWEDVCYFYTTATSATVNGTYSYTRASYVSSRSPYWLCARTSLVFDTSVITGTLVALSFNIYVDNINSANYVPEAWIEIVDTPTLSTALVTNDWLPLSNISAYDYSFNPVITGWASAALNVGALSYAESNSEMTLRLRDSFYDYNFYTNGLDPFADGYITYRHNYASYIPYLEYEVVTTFGQTINGIIIANVGKIDGKTKAGIARVSGV